MPVQFITRAEEISNDQYRAWVGFPPTTSQEDRHEVLRHLRDEVLPDNMIPIECDLEDIDCVWLPTIETFAKATSNGWRIDADFDFSELTSAEKDIIAGR